MNSKPAPDPTAVTAEGRRLVAEAQAIRLRNAAAMLAAARSLDRFAKLLVVLGHEPSARKVNG